MTGYWDPTDLSVTFRTEDAEFPTEPATLDEVETAGWAAYVGRTEDEPSA